MCDGKYHFDYHLFINHTVKFGSQVSPLCSELLNGEKCDLFKMFTSLVLFFFMISCVRSACLYLTLQNYTSPFSCASYDTVMTVCLVLMDKI